MFEIRLKGCDGDILIVAKYDESRMLGDPLRIGHHVTPKVTSSGQQ